MKVVQSIFVLLYKWDYGSKLNLFQYKAQTLTRILTLRQSHSVRKRKISLVEESLIEV